MNHQQLAEALAAIIEASGADATIEQVTRPFQGEPEAIAPDVGQPASCERCGLSYLTTADGLCPNNNCPAHFTSYAGWLAAGHAPIE